jgi:hypothetical protein
MTEPEPTQLNHIPERFQPWTKSGCTFISDPGERCGTEDTDTLSWLGRRCAAHPPIFEPEHAVQLAADGWVDTALSYCRWSA